MKDSLNYQEITQFSRKENEKGKGVAMTNYPLLDIFLTMLWFFLWILWIFLVVRILMDVFASKDMNGWAKAGWAILIILLPLLGVLLYVIVRGKSMQERQQQEIYAQDQAFRSSVKDAAGTSPAAELSKFAELHDRGVISDSEFEREKDKILSASSHS
jgi:uncharacterized membrane protein YcjF (UPF0283 family)